MMMVWAGPGLAEMMVVAMLQAQTSHVSWGGQAWALLLGMVPAVAWLLHAHAAAAVEEGLADGAAPAYSVWVDDHPCAHGAAHPAASASACLHQHAWHMSYAWVGYQPEA